ncbi:hypothetical protein ABT071_34725 [Streptomyces sp. NPDC002506]|uniref:hypothetical protein n=1 Tax=Streptomyces sp. NPDC002506 TaxID=3154536 RepID=UPI00331A6791
MPIQPTHHHTTNTTEETPMTTPPALPAAGTCAHVRRIETIETPFITELVAALSHLQNAATLAGTPDALLLPRGTTVSEQQMGIWAAGNTSRALVLLDEITAQYPSQPAHSTPEPRNRARRRASHWSAPEELK